MSSDLQHAAQLNHNNNPMVGAQRLLAIGFFIVAAKHEKAGKRSEIDDLNDKRRSSGKFGAILLFNTNPSSKTPLLHLAIPFKLPM